MMGIVSFMQERPHSAGGSEISIIDSLFHDSDWPTAYCTQFTAACNSADGSSISERGVEHPARYCTPPSRSREKERDMTTKPNVVDRPPPNTLRVNAWRDMPEDRTPARYEVQSGGADPKAIIVSKGPRVVLDALIKQPVFCASPVRISECVSVLRHDFGVPIDMTVYEKLPSVTKIEELQLKGYTVFVFKDENIPKDVLNTPKVIFLDLIHPD